MSRLLNSLLRRVCYCLDINITQMDHLGSTHQRKTLNRCNFLITNKQHNNYWQTPLINYPYFLIFWMAFNVCINKKKNPSGFFFLFKKLHHNINSINFEFLAESGDRLNQSIILDFMIIYIPTSQSLAWQICKFFRCSLSHIRLRHIMHNGPFLTAV